MPLLVHSAPLFVTKNLKSAWCCCCWSLFEVALCRLVVFSFGLLCLLCSRILFLTSAADHYVQAFYWVVSSLKRWSWSFGLVHIYKYLWADFDYVCYWRMRWLLFKKCCCFCWNNSSSSICFCREISVDIGVVCRLLLCAGCQRAASSVIWKNCTLESWITFVLIAFDCVHF